MDQPQRIVMQDSIATGLAAESPAGPIYLASGTKNAGSGSVQTTLSAVDLSGQVLWQRHFDGPTGAPRAINGGGVWLAHHGSDGPALENTSRDGSAGPRIAVSHQPGEKLGEVVILPDGFCTAWTSGPRYRGARVDRRDPDGSCIWSATIPPEKIAHASVMSAGPETGWRSQPKDPWIPGAFRLHHAEPLLVSGDRVLASYREVKSGLGISYFLDAATGEVINSTRPAPIGHKALSSRGEFVIGIHGYGEFASTRYTRAGTEAASWPTYGAMLVDQADRLLGLELDNRPAAQPRLRVLEQDGSLSAGPVLTGYATTYPALDHDGTMVFWRNGKLLTIDAEFSRRELFSEDRKKTPFYVSRILLLENGVVAFALNGDLFIFRTGLGPLEDSTWPCGEGNLGGNPVAAAA